MSRNEIALSGELVHVDALRHTPAGVPLLTMRLRHESTVMEAQRPRNVSFEAEAVALGAVAQRMTRLRAGQSVTLTGFVAPRSQRGRLLIVHVTDFESN